ncbi:MAG: T3SS effector HopA1 family protein, partial [Longimicrobiales bacterium]
MTVSRVAVEEVGWTVARAAAAVRLVALDRLELADTVVPLAPVAGVGSLEVLQTTLYQHVYCHPIGTAFDTTWRPHEDRDIGDVLLAASRTRERWDGGWIVESVDAGGGALLRRDGDRRWAAPQSYRATGAAGNGQPAVAELHIVPASRTEQPGFVHIFGETLPDGDEGAALARVYWNIGADAAPELVTRVTVTLNRFRVPFRLKCLDRHAAYDRCDAAVLYLKRRHWGWAMALLAETCRALAPAIAPAVPL